MSWVVVALVEATQISGPAKVCNVRSDSRCIALSGTFTTERMCCLHERA